LAKEKILKYEGYDISESLALSTGGGIEDWENISKSHVEMYRKYTPLDPDDFVLEVGCGMGRDAIELSKILSKEGKYVGFDIMKSSIEWANENIAKKHKNFKFYYYDIESPIHNSSGSIKTTDIRLPAKASSVDRIFLHSVFTHMFERDILHYLKEFNRVLKSDGLVLASFFIIDEPALRSLRSGRAIKNRHPLSFEHKLNAGCYVNDPDYPEGAVGFTPKKLKQMLRKSGLGIAGGHVHRGAWSGLKGSTGQDVLILGKQSRLDGFLQYAQPMKFTNR